MNTKRLLAYHAAVFLCAALLEAVMLGEPDGGSKAKALDVTIREWTVPTSNSNPHDPAVARAYAHSERIIKGKARS